LRFRVRLPYHALPPGDSSEDGACPAGVRTPLLCVRLTNDREGDPFLEALHEPPSKKTILLLEKLGIPAIKDVPPIITINPNRGVRQLNVFGFP
jgi:hypothetical protein